MDIVLALAQHGYLSGNHFQLRGIYGVDNWESVLQWYHPTDPYPQENNVLTWWNEYLVIKTQEDNVLVAKSNLKNKIQLAKDYASSIVTIFNATLDETLNQTIQPNRYNTLSALMESQPNTFKNRFNNDIREEMGLNFPTILATATAAQQRQYCVYLRTWIVEVAFLLSLYGSL